MKPKALAMLVIVIATIALIGSIIFYQRTSLEIEQEIASIKTEVIQQANSSVEESTRLDKQGQENSADSQVLPALDSIQQDKADEEVTEEERSARWKAQLYVDEVSQLVALSSEQSERLKNRYSDSIKSGANSDLAARDVLREVIGDDLLQQYETAKHAREERELNEAIADEVFSLSRKLSLSRVQETKVEEIVRTVREEVKPLSVQLEATMREAMQNHSGASQDKEKLRLSYDQVKALSKQLKTAKDQALADKLKDVLSDEQMNALLEMQSAASDRF